MTATRLTGTTDSLVEFQAHDFSRLRGLKNLPDAIVRAQILHYEDRVNRLNLLHRRLDETDPASALESELTRRASALRDDLQLRELHFENLSARPTRMSKRVEFALRLGWGSFEAWKEEFQALGRRDEIGWLTLLMDPVEYQLSHQGIALDGSNHPAGFLPVLVLDVSRRAFAGMERAAYLEALFENIDWACVADRQGISETAPSGGTCGHP